MKPATVVGIVLIVLGAISLVHRTFTYSTEETVLQVGPLEATVENQQTFSVPLWAGVGLIILGAAVVVVGGRR